MSANQLTIAAARDALRKGEISAVDLTMACLTAMDAGDGLNAFVHKTPEIALEQARAADARLAAGDAPSLCGIPLGIKDLFCTKGVPSQAGVEHPEGVQAGIRIDRHRAAVRGGRGDAGQAEHGRIRHGVVATRPRATAMWSTRGGAATSETPLTPGGSSGGSAAAVAADLCLGGDGHGYRRVDPPAGGLYRDRRDQADLWAGQPLGHRGLCLVAGSGRADDQIGARCGDHAGRRWRGMTRRIRPAPIWPVPDFEAALTGDIRGKMIGIPKEYRMDGMPAEIEALWADGHRRCCGCGGGDRRHLAAAHEIRAARLLRDRAGRGVVATSPAMTGCAMATAPSWRRATASPRCMKRPAPKASARKCSAG